MFEKNVSSQTSTKRELDNDGIATHCTSTELFLSRTYQPGTSSSNHLHHGICQDLRALSRGKSVVNKLLRDCQGLELAANDHSLLASNAFVKSPKPRSTGLFSAYSSASALTVKDRLPSFVKSRMGSSCDFVVKRICSLLRW